MSTVTLPLPIKSLGQNTKTLSVTLVQIGKTHVRVHFAKFDAAGSPAGADMRTAELESVRSILESAGKHEDRLASLLSKALEAEIAHAKAGDASAAAQAAREKLAAKAEAKATVTK